MGECKEDERDVAHKEEWTEDLVPVVRKEDAPLEIDDRLQVYIVEERNVLVLYQSTEEVLSVLIEQPLRVHDSDLHWPHEPLLLFLSLDGFTFSWGRLADRVRLEERFIC